MLASIRYRFPWLRHVFADGGYAGDKLRAALAKIGKLPVIKGKPVMIRVENFE
mgnify:CR=1 FL=1